MTDYAQARANMVEGQLRPNKVTDPAVLSAFGGVAREAFVPELFKGAAYADEDLPIGNGRYLMEPMIFARLVQEASIQPDDKVLIVGCGTGYGVAILARLAAAVVATEANGKLASQARAALAGVTNATLVEAGPEEGCAEHAPFNAIIVAGALSALPPKLAAQLAPSGRLVAVVKPPGRVMGEAVLVERIGDAQSRRVICDAGVNSLPGYAPEPAFTF